jgi:hypothetical protein
LGEKHKSKKGMYASQYAYACMVDLWLAILSLAKSDAKDLVIGLQLALLRFSWKVVVVALCKVCSTVTSPALFVFHLSV